MAALSTGFCNDIRIGIGIPVITEFGLLGLPIPTVRIGAGARGIAAWGRSVACGVAIAGIAGFRQSQLSPSPQCGALPLQLALQ